MVAPFPTFSPFPLPFFYPFLPFPTFPLSNTFSKRFPTFSRFPTPFPTIFPLSPPLSYPISTFSYHIPTFSYPFPTFFRFSLPFLKTYVRHRRGPHWPFRCLDIIRVNFVNTHKNFPPKKCFGFNLSLVSLDSFLDDHADQMQNFQSHKQYRLNYLGKCSLCSAWICSSSSLGPRPVFSSFFSVWGRHRSGLQWRNGRRPILSRASTRLPRTPCWPLFLIYPRSGD